MFIGGNVSFGIQQLSDQLVVNILSYHLEVNNCLTQCSNNGKCKFANNNSLLCTCDTHFTGATCSVDIRPCSSSPCLNNATCINDLVNLQPICECNEFYTGAFCENKIDLCQNVTCSHQGACYDINNVATCQCFYMFYGANCESQTVSMKAVKQVISISVVIAIIVILAMYATIVLLDLNKLARLIKGTPGSVKPKPVIKQRHVYVN